MPDENIFPDRLLVISKKLHQDIPLAGLLQEIADAAAELTNSENSAIWLLDKDSQYLALAASYLRVENLSEYTRLPIESSIAGQVYQHSEPLHINKVSESPLVLHPIEQGVAQEPYSLAETPITFAGNPLGALAVFNKHDKAPYTQQDRQTLETLAGYSGIAVQLQQTQASIEKIEAERNDLNRQKNDFIAITSHELRTPLGLVLGHATFLREVISNETHRKQLNVIVRNAERLKTIIDNLNQARNFETGAASIRRQRISLNTLLENVVQPFRQETAERGIKFRLALPDDDIQMECEPDKMSQALGNVIKNAIVFSDVGDSVSVGLHKLRTFAMISVTDTGIGIPSNELSQIFERFYQVEHHLTRKHGGMGLGLTVSKAIIEAHGGQIWVESKVNEGSAFTILLPMKENNNEGVL